MSECRVIELIWQIELNDMLDGFSAGLCNTVKQKKYVLNCGRQGEEQ
jgi:hypothetical protein